ncbi:glycosyltransferase family A protein [Algoriphagus machipongonensis]|nr:glycosyltransferase family A protein [Algoriphagus machipongonensis]
MNPNPDPFKDLGIPTLVISQNSTQTEVREDKFTFLSFDERGLSKSRNKAIENSTAEIGLIADDDIGYCEGFEEKILNAFDQFPDADILTFKIITPDGRPYKNYNSENFRHTRSSIFRVSSVEIVIRLDRVKEKGISFDENFGLGANFKSGEETIFLNDAMNAGLKIYYVPEYLVIHPLESSGKILDYQYFRSKGALIHRMYKNTIHLGLGVVFLLKQLAKPNKTISLSACLKAIFQGYYSSK